MQSKTFPMDKIEKVGELIRPLNVGQFNTDGCNPENVYLTIELIWDQSAFVLFVSLSLS